MATIAPRALAFIKEADARAPGRRRNSDGTYADKPGDHNVGTRGLVHAADLSLSMPGTPYWEPHFEQFDVHAWQREIAAQYIAATVSERSLRWPWLFDGGYMHGYSAVRKVDVIFTPSRSLTWRVDNSPPGEHIQHGHFSIAHTVRSEQDTQPIFGDGEQEDDMPLTDADFDEIERRVAKAVKQYVENKLGGYPNGKQYEDNVLWEKVASDARQKYGLSKR